MQIDLDSELTPKFKPLFYNQDRFLILKGSAGSGKSVFAAKKVIFRSIYEDNHHFLITRKVAATLKKSVWELFQKQISDWGLVNRVFYEVNKTELTIKLHKSKFSFIGMDDPEKLKSIVGITGAFCEEMTELNEQDWNQLNTRIRDKSPHYRQTIGAFNPVSEDHWIKEKIWDSEPMLPTKLHESNYKDNPYLDEEYRMLLESYKHTNDLYYQVYCLGNWGVVDKSGKFLYSFDAEKHVRNDIQHDPKLPVRLSFDFNIEPFVCTLYQMPNSDTVNVFDQIILNDSDIYQVTDMVKARYPNSFLQVTGDVSGGNRTGAVRGKASYWIAIKSELHLTSAQIRLRGQNLGLIESRVLCNSALIHKNIYLSSKLTNLINDCKYAKVDDTGMLVKDRNKNKNDSLDTFRYILDAEFPNIIKHHKK
jgi:PBSX family phage terminase large subunit